MVLLTWLALRNEPYQRVESGGDYLIKDGVKQPGFLIPLLQSSSTINDIVIFFQETQQAQKVYDDLQKELNRKDITVRLHPIKWNHDDPTDHEALLGFLQKEIPPLRRRFPKEQLLINISAGTRSMHTVWILLATSGFIKKPFQLIQTSKNKKQDTRKHFTPVRFELPSFKKLCKLISHR